MASKKNEDFLCGVQEIVEFLGVSDSLFKRFIRAGMPARYDGQWYANKTLITRWHQTWTGINMKGSVDDNGEKKITP